MLQSRLSWLQRFQGSYDVSPAFSKVSSVLTKFLTKLTSGVSLLRFCDISIFQVKDEVLCEVITSQDRVY